MWPTPVLPSSHTMVGPRGLRDSWATAPFGYQVSTTPVVSVAFVLQMVYTARVALSSGWPPVWSS